MSAAPERVGVGVIGTGVVFPSHATALQHFPAAAVLVGVADSNPAKLREATNQVFVPYSFGDYRPLLERDDVHVVVVATPPSTHAPIVGDALAAGKLVVCEKPIATTLADADRIVEMGAAHPGRISIVHQLRYAVDMQRAVWLRDQGHLGKLLYGRFTRIDGLAGSPAVESGWWGSWSAAGGGFVMTKFIHHLDQMCHMFGEPVHVEAVAETLAEPIESEDAFAATVRFANGAIVSCSGAACLRGYDVTWDVVGEMGWARAPWMYVNRDPSRQAAVESELLHSVPDEAVAPARPALPVRATRKVLRKLGLLPRPPWKPPTNQHVPYWAAVLEAIRNGSPLPVPPAEGRRALDLCIGIYASALTGQPANLPVASDSPYYRGITAAAYHDRTRPI